MTQSFFVQQLLQLHTRLFHTTTVGTIDYINLKNNEDDEGRDKKGEGGLAVRCTARTNQEQTTKTTTETDFLRTRASV